MNRRVTPAARAALTRRRQRAASLPKTQSDRMSSGNARSQAPQQIETEEVHDLPIKEVISSPGRIPTKTNNQSHVAGGKPKAQSNIPRYNNHPPHSPKSTQSRMKIDPGNRGKPPLKEVVQGSPRNLSPLAQRAVQSLAQRSNFSSGATLTTTGLTTTSASRSASQDKISVAYSYNDSHEIESHDTKDTTDVNSSIQPGTSSSYRALPAKPASKNVAGKPKMKMISRENSDTGISKQNSYTRSHDVHGTHTPSSPRQHTYVEQRGRPSRVEQQETFPNQHGGMARIQVARSDSPLEARMRKLEASEPTNQLRYDDNEYKATSPGRRHMEPTGRGAAEVRPFSSSQQENEMLGIRQQHEGIDVKPSSSTFQRRGQSHRSPEEGPLEARTMKMASTDSRNQLSSSPRQPFVIPRRNNSRDSRVTPPASGRKNQQIATSPSQFNTLQTTSPLRHVPSNNSDGASGKGGYQRKVVLSPRDALESNPPSRSLFEKSFSTSRTPASPSTAQKAESKNHQSPILRRNISPHRPVFNRPPVTYSPRTENRPEPRYSHSSRTAANERSAMEDNQRGYVSVSPRSQAHTTNTRANQYDNNVTSSVKRQRPPPIDTKSPAADTGGTKTNAYFSQQSPHRGASPHYKARSTSNLAPKDRGSPYRSSTTNIFPSGATSPGVQQLSSILMDSYSAADVSTIPDLHYRKHGAHPSPSQNMAQDRSHLMDNGQLRQSRVNNGDDHDNYENPIAADEWKLDVLDATCLLSGSFVMLKMYGSSLSIRARKGHTFKNFLVEHSGHCLSREDELLLLTKASSNRQGNSDGVIRHGDTIVLRSVFAQKALGIRKVKRGDLHSPIELGFFGSDESPGSQWTVLGSKIAKEVTVGKAAVNDVESANRYHSKPCYVRSGDPVLLRNIHNGGILSIDNSGSVDLLTDSYNQGSQYDGSSEDPSLIGRLQHHSKLMPSRHETFQLVTESTPPCPPWISGKDYDARIFLTGSYLMQPHRNQRNAKFEADLFVESNRSSILSHRHFLAGSGSLSANLREKVLLDEVIGSFLGLEGKYIRLKGATGRTSTFDDFEFQLFDADGVSFDTSLRNLVDQILPLSTSFVRVRNFVASHHPGYEFGKVMHAFCEGLDGLLQDYVSFVSQLERRFRQGDEKPESLTMKNVYFQITSSLHSMSILEHSTKAVFDRKGGALLNALRVLDTRVYMGDMVARKVLGILLEKASAPYLDMVTEWLQSGVLNDQYGEFMIGRSQHNCLKATSLRSNRDAWTELFVIREEHVLEVVSAEWMKQKVLTTGKYWNAVQACNTDDGKLPTTTDGNHVRAPPINSDSSILSSYIDSMYHGASQALVQLLMTDFNLMASLHVVKRYFLLDQGDFLMNFLDEAETELLKDSSRISLGRVQHWLSMSIQAVETNGDEDQGLDFSQQHRDLYKVTPASLTCQFSSQAKVGHLDALLASGAIPGHNALEIPPEDKMEGPNTGIEAFVIDFDQVPFPTSLVLSKQTMESYKLLFRHLFFAKHVERRLVGVWRDHQSLKNLQSVRGLLGRTFLLRQRMLHFLQNLLYYMSFEVIESNWTEMLASIDPSVINGSIPTQREQTVDDILGIHGEFLRRTMDACLLTNRELFGSLTKLMNTCLLFSDQMRRFMSSTRIYDDKSNIATEKRRAVQRNLNDRGSSRPAVDKKALRRSLASSREERESHLNRQTRRVGREVSSESYMRMVARFEEVFIADLSDFMSLLNSHTATGMMANLGSRLSDYNGCLTAPTNK